MRIKAIYLLSVLFISVLFSNGMRIGFIDSQQIMQELDEVRAVQIEVDKEQKKLEAELTTMMGKRDSLIQSYEVQKIMLLEQRKSEKKQEIEDLERRIQTFQMEKFGPNSGEIYRIQNQLFAPVLAKIQSAIEKVGEEQGYDYIIDAVSGALVFADSDHNLTFAVIEELRKNDLENDNKEN